MTKLTQKLLRECLLYDPATGIFTWVAPTSKRVRAGGVAGTVNANGYRVIGVGGKKYRAHRLAYLYMVGAWPPSQMDHQNMAKDDNRWDNLRLATNGQNGRNTAPRGTSRFKGVSWSSYTRKWRAAASFEGKTRHLGFYGTEDAAAGAYAKFAMEKFPKFARLT